MCCWCTDTELHGMIMNMICAAVVFCFILIVAAVDPLGINTTLLCHDIRALICCMLCLPFISYCLSNIQCYYMPYSPFVSYCLLNI